MTTRLALVSDTHLPRFGRRLPAALVEGIASARVDGIVHAGDWTEPLAVGLFEALAPVEGVAGNNDAPELHERFGTRRVVDVDGVLIGVTHGHLGRGRTTPERAAGMFEDVGGVQAVVFGHSHIPIIRRLDDGRLLVNPGSPTDRRRQPSFSWGLMTVEDGAIRGLEIRCYDDRSP